VIPGCFSGMSMRTFGSFAFGAFENEVQLHSRRVIEDGDGLGNDRAGGLREAEKGVEAHRALEVVHANTDVGEARDGDRSGLVFCHLPPDVEVNPVRRGDSPDKAK